MKKALYWLPRILGVGFIVFISLFAMDAFGGNQTPTQMVLGFFIHMIPTFLLIIILLIAWKVEWVGGIFFIAIGLFYCLFAQGQHWSAYCLVAGPPILIGILFILQYVLFRKWDKEDARKPRKPFEPKQPS